MKLLCKSFFDISAYSSWSKIATGAFGTVFECSTSFVDPTVVAIKQLSFPNSIYDRCVLYDIFNEITSLQEFRAEQCATTLYDYGVDDNNYYIVMRRYSGSLREWRQRQTSCLADNLPIYLQVFKQALKAVEVVHSHFVTHYDLKCDNFMLENKGDDEDSSINVALGDFGECKLFTNEDDEYDLKPRGTECIKSPEMLTLTINTKKETDQYDRRKKVGTTRASDIWSLGCLFYELLTGDYLFSSEEYVVFYVRVTQSEEILTPEKKNLLNNNSYLLDFLNYILIRDPGRRPDIGKVVNRFKHIYGLLSNSTASPANDIVASPTSALRGLTTLEQLLTNCNEMINAENTEKVDADSKKQKIGLESPGIIKLLKNVMMCKKEFLYENIEDIITNQHVTHIIMPKSYYRTYIDQYFTVMTVNTEKSRNAYDILPGVLDFCRNVALHHGVLLFLDDNPQLNNDDKKEGIMRECVLACMSYALQTGGYETWTLVNSQSFFLWVSNAVLSRLTKWVSLTMK